MLQTFLNILVFTKSESQISAAVTFKVLVFGSFFGALHRHFPTALKMEGSSLSGDAQRKTAAPANFSPFFPDETFEFEQGN